MGSWWLFLLLSSQLVAQDSVVDATFEIGLRWLRGDSSLFSNAINTTATTTESVAQATLQDAANATTEDARRTDLVRAVTAAEEVTRQSAVTTTTEAVGIRDASTEGSLTDAETADWTTTEEAVPTVPWLVNATLVSPDELALEIAKVPDPMLHMVDNGDGSSSLVVVSGRLGASTTTPAIDTTTFATEPTTPSTTTIPSTTTAAVSNVTSPYQILLDYLRPFIFGRFSVDATTTSPSTTGATTVTLPTAAGTTPPPVPATTFVDPRQSLLVLTTAPTVPEYSNQAASTTDLPTSGAITQDVSTTTQFPAEFRATVDQRPVSVIAAVPSVKTTHAPTSHATTLRQTTATAVSTGGFDVRTPVIVKATTTPQSVQPLTEAPTASFPAVFDLFGASIDPGSQTPASGDYSTPPTAAEEPVYRHFYDPSQLMQTF
ncbi:hypothetical protein V5799_022926 [Amblyomma americanum]|uniref:Secreted protein n=1 Tax=Amblyomma americanum TaxID=6943 RepID=A0AAQ4FJ79_AMBAM